MDLVHDMMTDAIEYHMSLRTGRNAGPTFHDDLRQLRPPAGNCFRVMQLQLMSISMALLLVPFILPVRDACRLSPAGEWPTEQWAFYVSVLPAVSIMYVAPVLLARSLAESLHQGDELQRMVAYVRIQRFVRRWLRRRAIYKPEVSPSTAKVDWVAVAPSLHVVHAALTEPIDLAIGLRQLAPLLVLVVPVAAVAIVGSIVGAWLVGFAFPFTAIIAGMPGYNSLSTITAGYMYFTGVSKANCWRIWKILTVLLVMVFCVSMVFAGLAFAINRYPEHELFIALCFPVTKKVAKFVLKAILDKMDHFLVLYFPFNAYIEALVVVFPMAILPSAVTASTFVLVQLTDMATVAWSLRLIWLPALRNDGSLFLNRLNRKDDQEKVLVHNPVNTKIATDQGEQERRQVSQVAHEKQLMEVEFAIVTMVVEEGTELVIPLLISMVECFLYFGYNSHAIPSVSSLSGEEFATSLGFKLGLFVVQLGTFRVFRMLVDNHTELNLVAIQYWAGRRHFLALAFGPAAMTIYCMTSMMPHYNFNLDALQHLVADDTQGNFWHVRPVGCVVMGSMSL